MPSRSPLTAVRRQAATILALTPAWFSIACSLPSTSSEASDVARLERFSYLVTLDGTEVVVRAFRGGTRGGRPVIYIHETPGDALNWSDFLTDPVADTESLALDRPGFGASSPGRAFPSLSDQAAAIEPLLTDGQKPILVGHSLGGPIAAAVAAEHPDRIGGLVILAGSLDPELEQVLFIQHVGEWPLIRSVIPRWLRNTNRELLPLEAELEQLAARLDRVTAPIEIIHGTKDAQVPYANVEFMMHAFANAESIRLTRLEGVNHFLPWNSSGVIREAIARLSESPDHNAP